MASKPAPTPRKARGPSHHRPYRRPEVGRPTTYENAFCNRVIYGGTYGLSFAQLAHDLGTTRQLLYVWAERHPAFKDALAQARESALAWWETEGREGMWAGKEFNDRMWKMFATNQHRDDYKERVEVSGTLARIDFSRLTDEQLAAISEGQHPYEVLAPKREVLAPGEVVDADVVSTESRDQSVVQATKVESVVEATILEEPAQPPEGPGTTSDD